MSRLPTQELLSDLIDEGSWEGWDGDSPGMSRWESGEYATELRAAAETSGVSESIHTGLARISNHKVAVIASDFDFLAGSIGRDAAQRIIGAFDRATSRGLAVVGLPTSGGTRMQEGTPAFLLMAAIAAAVQRHQDAGLPYLLYLRHPTTGGVFATWGSLGDVTFAQPGALVGFLGPRVFESLNGEPFPEGVQTGEGLQGAGVIDGVVDPWEWRVIVTSLLDAWEGAPAASIQLQDPTPTPGESVDSSELHDPGEPWAGSHEPQGSVHQNSMDTGAVGGSVSLESDGWECIQRTRNPERPGVQELLAAADHFVTLSGTQEGQVARATLLVVAEFGGRGCVVVGQDRAAQETGHLIGPADLRVARRAMRLAERWGLPLLTVIDTQGGELSPSAERGALAGEIARCLSQLSTVATPTISLLLGGGGGGVALALLPADRVLAVTDSWVTPLPAEGASIIRFRTIDRADEMARSQSITVADLRDAGAVDRILPKVSAADSAESIPRMKAVAEAVADELKRASQRDVDLAARASRWQKIGGPQSS
jgi:acetyl-CoA carboxylase beta subunit/acetyl-CoA carboxylase alpha subunit